MPPPTPTNLESMDLAPDEVAYIVALRAEKAKKQQIKETYLKLLETAHQFATWEYENCGSPGSSWGQFADDFNAPTFGPHLQRPDAYDFIRAMMIIALAAGTPSDLRTKEQIETLLHIGKYGMLK